VILPLSPVSFGIVILAAFSAGFVDAIAGGGGLLTLPAFLAVGFPPHLALGTNKGQAVFGAIMSARAFYKRGEVNVDRAPKAFAMAFLGSLTGATLLLRVRPEPLRPIVLGLLVAVAFLITFRRPKEKVSEAKPAATVPLLAMAFGLGVYDGFFGPGVGTMLIVAYATLFGDRLVRASGNAKVNNLASNLAAVLLFGYRGTVLWSVALPMAFANAVGATLGSRVAVRQGDRFIRGVVLTVVCLLVTKIGLDMLR
jgi:uncharacterized membrane protein YfcA